MNQSGPLYDMASALETLAPWLEHHLPDLDPVARRHFVQLVTGRSEQQALVRRALAAASPFQADPERNDTQVQRSIRATRRTRETVSYPFLLPILASVPGDHAFLTRDQTNHTADCNLVLVGWATAAVSLPRGFVVYPTDGAWADDARALLHRLKTLLPPGRPVTRLADRVHAGDPLLSCLDDLGWG